MNRRAKTVAMTLALMASWACARKSNPGPDTASPTLPAVSFIKPSAGADFVAPASITIAASASSSNGSIVRVELFVGASKLGEAVSPPYEIVWRDVAAGTYDLTARAFDDAGTSADASLRLTVREGTLVSIDGGTFTIGDSTNPKTSPAHSVTISSFYLSKYELTFDEYDAFTTATGHAPAGSSFNGVEQGRGRKPVFNVSWYDAVEYCNWRSAQEGLTYAYAIDKSTQDPNNTSTKDSLKWTVTVDPKANGYRLPTEAEWEYAARGGSLSHGFTYSGSNDPGEVAWYGGRDGSGTAAAKGASSEVGTKKANEIGLYDMSGNVHEWVWDRYDTARPGYATDQPETDPTGIAGTYDRFILRGGQTGAPAECLVVTSRFFKNPTFTMCPAGFRIARSKG